MATQLVPYNTAMQLGSGFNSFTQTLCIDNAVVRDTELLAKAQSAETEPKEVAQSVKYKTSVITNTSDVTDEMNINGAFNIKYDQLAVDGNGKFINTNKIKESDINIMVSVKVVNQTIHDHSLTKFQPVSHFKDISPQRLVEVYGDSFISGWQEGGEFLAVISIKAKNRDQAQTIAAEARVAFSHNKSPPPEGGNGKDLSIDLNAKFDKIKKDLAAGNEVSVSVTWTGGGQRIKDPEKDWDFDTMKEVALRFHDLCAKTPMRTHALLTKYSALRSFYTTQSFDIPMYDKTGTYTNVLQDAYLDYKSILASIQTLAFDVAEGTRALVVNPRAVKAVEQVKTAGGSGEAGAKNPEAKTPSGTDTESADGNDDSSSGILVKSAPKEVTFPPPSIDKPFEPTIAGLEDARLQCRFMMNRIVQEIDNIAIRPEIATDETRNPPYLSPFLFKMMLPLGMLLPAENDQVSQAVTASKVDPDSLAKKFTSMAG